MLSQRLSRSGHRVLVYGKRALASVYDPVREADRFARDALRDSPDRRLVILVGVSSSHLFKAVAEHPKVDAVLPVYLDPAVHEAAGAGPDSWHPGLPLSLHDYLQQRIDESDLSRLQVLTWAPATAVFPEAARTCGSRIVRFIKDLRANYATTTRLGPVWVRNTILNFARFSPNGLRVVPEPGRVLVIAASGPSLESAAAGVAGERGGVDLWALPSALEPLAAGGLHPDLVISTDGGYYAARHLDTAALLRIPLALPLAAAGGRAIHEAPLLPLLQPYLLETTLWRSIGTVLPQRVVSQGTVAATALSLAVAMGYRTVVFAGLDFAYRDALSHARPGAFDRYYRVLQDRLRPAHGRMVAGAFEGTTKTHPPWRSSEALLAYEAWFRRRVPAESARLYRLCPPVPGVGPGRDLTRTGLRDMVRARTATTAWGSRLSSHHLETRAGRVSQALRLTGEWARSIEALAHGAPEALRRPADWPPLIRELLFFTDLRVFSRMVSAEADDAEARHALEATAALLASLAARISRGTA